MKIKKILATIVVIIIIVMFVLSLAPGLYGVF